MNVLHVITGLNDGGAEAVLYRLVTHDSEDSHHVVSLTGEGKYGLLLRKAGISVTCLDMPRGRITWQGLKKLRQVLRSQSIEVVQTWMYHADFLGGLLSWLEDVPVVWGIRNSTLDKGKSTLSTRWVARACGLLSHWVPQRIVACAQAAVEVHARLGYERQHMVVIPNGYDLTRFQPDLSARRRLRQEWGIPDDMPLIGMVARFDPQKDHGNLIAALAQLFKQGKIFSAVLVGTYVDERNGFLVERLRTENLARHVRLLGPTNDVPGLMNALDIHVLSSSSEAFPNVLAEAMACGTPCVTTDVGDAAWIVGDTGWVVPPKDATALAQAIEMALCAWHRKTEWLRRQKACCARMAQHFGIGVMVERYRAVWQSVAKSRVQ